jgi:L-ascorbate metabolism protein UlaG (beta-lactamase superfamily)
MIILNLLRNTAAAAGAILIAGCANVEGTKSINNTAEAASAQAVKFQQIRSATIKVEYAGTTFLIDPMLGKKGSYPGFEGTYNSQLRNPLVELPMPVSEAMKADAVIVTHTSHLDHWDEAAKRSLPRNIPIFAQNEEDAESIRKEGFENVRVLTENIDFNGTRLSKTEGQHGSDAMVAGRGKRLGKSSGVVFQRPGYKTVYVAGDTVWNGFVEAAIKGYRPDVIVLNACYGRLVGYEGAFIMGKEDLYRAYRAAPGARIIGSHMESIAHCTQTRKDLRDYVAEMGLSPQRVLVPEDGESYSF